MGDYLKKISLALVWAVLLTCQSQKGMRLLPEHNRNFSPVMRSGVFMLTLKGEVVFISTSKHALRAIIEHQTADIYPFDGYTVMPMDEEEARWTANELIKLYRPAYNNKGEYV